MLAKRFRLAVLAGSNVSSCAAPSAIPPEAALANTVWVRPYPHDAELREVQYADFTLLAFRAPGKCLLVSSYHSLGDGDTIIVATEPGVRVDSGRY